MTTSSLRDRVASAIEELTGTPAASLDPSMPLAELGLDSLTLTQLASRLRRLFGVTLGFREFFSTTRTIDAICARIATSGSAAVASAPASAAASPVAADSRVAPPMSVYATAGEGAGAIVPMLVAQLE